MEGTIKQNPREGMYPERDIMVIAHNLMAMNTSRQFGINNKKLRGSMEKLSSGYKINRAADDAAGLAISEKMRREIRGLNQGTANMQDGVSWVQIGDGAMEEVNDILHRMTELSVKSANGTLSDSDRAAIDLELQQLKVEINRINETTKFNDMRIFSTDHTKPEDLTEFTIRELTGSPTDLSIFNATYDDTTGDVTWGGILFHGSRVPWTDIAPDMVYMDGNTQRFHEGTWMYMDAQGRSLTFSAKEGDTVPSMTRMFKVEAGIDGLRIDGDLIQWKDIKNEVGETIHDTDYVNGRWTAQYHGMTMTFDIANAFGGFADMVRAINNSHDDQYSYKTYAHYSKGDAVQAVDAAVNISGVRVSEDVARNIVAGNHYTVGADENGIWIDMEDAAGTRTEIVGSKKTWAELGINSWDRGTDIRADYNYYKYNDNDGTNDTYIRFSFTLADITSRDSVIDGLDGMDIWHTPYSNYKLDMLDTHSDPGNIEEIKLIYSSTNVTLQNELDLGRDFDDPTDEIGTNPLQYNPGTSTVSLSYAGGAGDVITYTGSDIPVRTQMDADLEKCAKETLARKIAQTLAGVPEGLDLGRKDLKVLLGAGTGKVTESGQLSETLVLTTSMEISDGPYPGGDMNSGTRHWSAHIDFSDMGMGPGAAHQIWELIGSGFDSTCNSSNCEKHYSVKFVYDTEGNRATVDGYRYRIDESRGKVNSFISSSDVNPVLEISVSSLIKNGVTNGEELARAIVEIASEGFDTHYQQYAADGAILYVLDSRERGGNAPKAKFYTTPYHVDNKNTYTINLTSVENGSHGIQYKYDYDDYSDLFSVSMQRDDAAGAYVKNADGSYDAYDTSNPAHAGVPRYNIQVSYKNADGTVDSRTGTETVNVFGMSLNVNTKGDSAGARNSYITKAIHDMTDPAQVKFKLAARDFTRASLYGDENFNVAIDTEASPYFMALPYQKPGEKMPETIRIQKSGDVPNCLRIPKFALNCEALGLTGANCLTQDSSRNTIDMVSYALKSVSKKRSTYGALQNRLEHAMNSNRNVSENTTDAESRIRDTDMAKEMITLTSTQLISQAVQSMLAQANQSNQGVLNLLS